MRTLSARILLGFAVLTLTFGVITATIVFNMSRVEDQIQVVRKAYVPLALQSKELTRIQQDLSSYLEEGFTDWPNLLSADSALVRKRDQRNKSLETLRQYPRNLTELAEADAKQFDEDFAMMQRQIDALKPDYDAIHAAAGKSLPIDDATVIEPLKRIKAGEAKLAGFAKGNSNTFERRVESRTQRVEENEHILRRWTIGLGLAAVVLGLVTTLWVVVTLRPLRRLREAARRVAAGNYESRIEERGPTEVADLARELNSMARAVEERERELVRSERLAAVGKMAAMITHEVRNPLSSIGLNTELLEDELADLPGDAKNLCRSIHREVDRLTAITEEYLAFARLPKPKLAYEAVNPLVGALAAFVREDLAAKQVDLAIELVDGDPIALIDAAQLRQCLINLVRNASEAVASKGRGKVTLRTKRASERVLIEVEDDGTGIPPDVLPKLFDPFFSTKEGGSGLGLALTQQIVKDHGGDLTVDSTVGKGTVFRVAVSARP
ncbi:MAG: HAMP domain-containing protein [Deltaproteobacteria bacterium]|nr:HAMP domain-containing protein [Deltaproteobacteria bacterium]